ncbi:MAG: transposase [Actinomycetia bacterium]|nr:transposase [Actinomycetes bacterium]
MQQIKIKQCLLQLPPFKTFGDFLGASPHLHILTCDGGFGECGMFYASHIDINAEELEPLFRHKVLSMLKKKGLITEAAIELTSSWRHLRI